MRLHLAIGALLATWFLAGPAHGQKYDLTSYLGRESPELVSEKEHWIGVSEPLTLAGLKGKVIWLHFNF